MKALLLLLFPIVLCAQQNTEVFLYTLEKDSTSWILKNGENISKNEGYDSQPSFYKDSLVLYASNRGNYTDIASYNIYTRETTYISDTPKGGEYSPEKIPGSKNISAVRLDDSGLQRLYTYDHLGNNSVLIPNKKVAYPRWFAQDTIITICIVEDGLALYIHDFSIDEPSESYAHKVGRSVHRIPNTRKISFIDQKDDWTVKSLDIDTKTIETIITTDGSEDITWLPDGTLLMAKENQILAYMPNRDSGWRLFYDFADTDIRSVSRMSVSKDGGRIAIVGSVKTK